MRRQERKERKEKLKAEQREHELAYSALQRRKLEGDVRQSKMRQSTLDVFKGYKINEYNLPKPPPKQNVTRVTFGDIKGDNVRKRVASQNSIYGSD